MKKNEKGFMQDEANLEKVAGGFGGPSAAGGAVNTSTHVQTGDITGATVSTVKTNEENINKRQEVKFGNVAGGLSGVNFSNQ